MSETTQVTVRNESGAYEAVVDGAVAGRLVSSSRTAGWR